LSFIDETLAHLEKIKYFTKLNIRQTFHRIKIANAESKNLIIFRTRFDVYKYRVLSFELCNESTTYQHYMNDVFFDYLNDFMSIYINDILIYNNFKRKHVKHVKKNVAAFTKCKSADQYRQMRIFRLWNQIFRFHYRSKRYQNESRKVETILQWAISQNLK
jgi:hypothetical protein